jgi:PAS domain S-box-containing protein
MDLRTKLVFALVAVALSTMVALGGFMYFFANRQLRNTRLQQLDGLAQSMDDGLSLIRDGWEDRVRLIASRTQLRDILRQSDLATNQQARARIRRILADAYGSGQAVAALAVYDARGRFVASAGWGTESDLLDSLTALPSPRDSVRYERVLSSEAEELRIAYSAPLTSDGTPNGELVGVLQARLNAEALVRLTRNRAGLGGTGETLIAIRDAGGGVRVLTQGGPGSPPTWRSVGIGDPSDPVTLAMEGKEGAEYKGLIDYRGNPVWAAVRYIPEVDWGVIVKIDASEAGEPGDSYRDTVTDVIISLAALAILIGTIMGLRFAKPIQELAAAADRIREGDLSVRAAVNSQDEVGHLARRFNQMAEELEQRVTLMREFQNYFDYSLDMLCIAGTDGYFKRVNPAFERVLGWSVEELLARRFLDFVHPDDLAKTEREIARLAQGLPTISFENRYACFDGSERILAWTAHPEPETGLIYAIARDVTDLHAEREVARATIAALESRLEDATGEPGGNP